MAGCATRSFWPWPRHPRDEDRDKFVEALALAAAGGRRAGGRGAGGTGHQLHDRGNGRARCRRSSRPAARPSSPSRASRWCDLLNFWTEENSDVDEDPDPAKAYVGWYKMFADYYPRGGHRVGASSAGDADSWKRRLAAVDWEAGQAARGRAVFERRACHRCHEQNGHLGPELKGAVSRLSRDDMFTAIIDPNLEVSPAFQTTVIATNSGQVYHGLVVYESPEATLAADRAGHHGAGHQHRPVVGAAQPLVVDAHRTAGHALRPAT